MKKEAYRNRPTKYSVKQILKAIENTYGVIASIAASLGCSSDTVRSYIEKFDVVRKAVENEQDKAIMVAENTMIKQAAEGNIKAAAFILEHLGKKDGWGKEISVETTHNYMSPDNTLIQCPDMEDALLISEFLSSDNPIRYRINDD